MKYNIIPVALCLTAAAITACDDYLEQTPPSSLTPEGFFSSDSKIQAVANKFYQDVLPGHSQWSYGLYANDNNTDNQSGTSADNKYGDGLWKTSNDNGNWAWSNIRNINYQLSEILKAYEKGEINGTENTIRQYIGEIYFMRAYCYFDMLQKWGDLPIISEPLPVDETVLVENNKRSPRNEVARFILSDLDKALEFMSDGFDKRHTRINPDAALTFRSRVALYEGSWLTYFAGTPFVPLGQGWPGATKDYNASYQYPSGSIEAEAKYFLEEAVKSAEKVAEKYKGALAINIGEIPQKEGDAENPYFNIWGTLDMSNSPEVLLWREYNKGLGVNNCVEVALQHGDYGVGITRSLVESYLMADGKPIYASSYAYSDQTIADVATNRDPRLTIFLKVPGQVNMFKNMDASEDHGVEIEPTPDVIGKTAETCYSTGYTIRKGGTFDKAQTGNGNCANAACIFRATEALLNYIEAEYMLTKSLSSGHIVEYWTAVRTAAGFTGEAANPSTTIAVTDMSKETADWGAYSAGELLSDATLYNIRRERRCELIAEGLRNMDLHRWRSLDQLITTRAHIEGFHLWNTPMTDWYKDLKDQKGNSIFISDGSTNATVSSPELSEYYRPHEVNQANNSFYNGLTWHMAHYLEPLPLKQFLLTASDHATYSKSPLYQNPYWPTEPDMPAEK